MSATHHTDFVNKKGIHWHLTISKSKKHLQTTKRVEVSVAAKVPGIWAPSRGNKANK